MVMGDMLWNKSRTVSYTHLVRHDLQGDEEGCQDAAGQQLAPVGKYNARYCGWDVGKGDELPDEMCIRDSCHP